MYSIYSFFLTAIVQHIEIVKKRKKKKQEYSFFGSPECYFTFYCSAAFLKDCRLLRNESRYRRST